MTRWLERRERIQVLSDFLNWTPEHGEGQSSYQDLMGPACIGALTLKMAQGPSQWRVLFDVLVRDYGALEFQDALADFIAQANYPEASGAALWQCAHNTHIPFSGVPVYYNVKFTKGGKSEIVDAIHVWPDHKDHGRIIPGRFNTVIVTG